MTTCTMVSQWMKTNLELFQGMLLFKDLDISRAGSTLWNKPFFFKKRSSSPALFVIKVDPVRSGFKFYLGHSIGPQKSFNPALNIITFKVNRNFNQALCFK